MLIAELRPRIVSVDLNPPTSTTGGWSSGEAT
jgi:hypothetical protein